jgi:ParB family chromosome partitioning protein
MAEKKSFVTNRVKETQQGEPVMEVSVKDNKTTNDVINVLTIDINNVKYNPYQSRFKIDPESVQGLAQNIAEVGLINPISVVKRGKEYVIASGHRRYEAMKSLGYTTIQVIIKEMDDTKLASSNVSENTQRKNISPIEIALAYNDLKGLLGSNRKVAEELKMSEATISNYIAMATKLSDEIITDLKNHTDLKSVNFLTKLTGISEDKQKEFYTKVKDGKIKIGTAILDMNKLIKEEKQGKTFFEQKVKSLRNKASIVINGNKLQVKGKVISFHQNEKEELIKALENVLADFYAKYDRKIEKDS